MQTVTVDFASYQRETQRIQAMEKRIEELRELLRDVYDVVRSGEPVSNGLLSRVQEHMAIGRVRRDD